MPRRFSRFPTFLFLACWWWVISHPLLLTAQPAEANRSSANMRLRLQNDSVGFGKVIPCPQPEVIAWQNEGFPEPFLFDLNAVRSITGTRAAAIPSPASEAQFRVATTTGDVFVGSIVRLDDQQLVINSSVLGIIAIPRQDAASFSQSGPPGEIVYPGLIEDKAWTCLSRSGDWETKRAVLAARRQGASIRGDVNLPEKCEILLSLAWKGVPDFVIHLGTEGGSKDGSKDGHEGGREGGNKPNRPAPAAARLEVWNRNMVLVRETPQKADLLKVAELNPAVTEIELTIFLDQPRGVASVRDFSGRSLGRLSVPDAEPWIGPSIRIDNHGPSLTVNRLEVRQWDGISFLEGDRPNSIVLRSGITQEGTVLDLEPEKKLLRLQTPASELLEFPLDRIVFASLNSRDSKVADDPTTSPPERRSAVEIVLSDQSRVTGDWLPGFNSQLRFYSERWQRNFQFDPDRLVAIGTLFTNPIAPSINSRNGTLTLGNSELAGCLEESDSYAASAANSKNAANPEGPSGSANDFVLGRVLRWRPHGSRTSSGLPGNSPGKIVFHHHPSSSSSDPWLTLDERVESEGDDRRVLGPDERSGATDSQYPIHPITFVSGDTIDGQVVRIDQQGMHMRSADSPVQFVKHSAMDNVWLNKLASGVKAASQSKLERLMKVPARLKDDPPTHLLLSVDGDFLRCRLLELKHDQALLELRGELHSMPRDNIARIVWLHQRQWLAGSTANDRSSLNESKHAEQRIHLTIGNRGITFVPQQFSSGVLSGESDLLGKCQIPLGEIRQILFGPRLDARIAEFRENPWVLSLSPSPNAWSESNPTPD